MSRDLATCTVCGEEEGGDEYGCEQEIPCPHCEDEERNGKGPEGSYCETLDHENGHIFPHNFEYLDGCSHGCICPDDRWQGE